MDFLNPLGLLSSQNISKTLRSRPSWQISKKKHIKSIADWDKKNQPLQTIAQTTKYLLNRFQDTSFSPIHKLKQKKSKHQ